MCKIELESTKFCSCPENLDLNKQANASNYIWILDIAKALKYDDIM